MDLKKLQKIRNKAGIYALINDDNLIYIGSSFNMYTRVLEHIASAKITFNHILDVIVSEDAHTQDMEEIRIIEMGIICATRPPSNKICFDDFREWIYSLPHKQYTNKEIIRFEYIIGEAVNYLNRQLPSRRGE